MDEMKKLGCHIQAALNADVPPELVAAITTTNHGGRLQMIFMEASAHLLDAHKAVQGRPFSADAKTKRNRAKALVDLVRARISVVGCRRPTVNRLISLLDARQSVNVVAIKRAA